MAQQRKNDRTRSRTEVRREPMSVALRAKQFMPFRAVTGLEEAIRKKEQELEGYDQIEHIAEADADISPDNEME